MRPGVQGPTCAFVTVGCKVNQYDTEALRESFRRHGYRIVEPDDAADVYVINTCVVTAGGQARSRRAVRRARTAAPRAVVAVVGCYPQVAADAAVADGADVVVGTVDRHLLPELVDEALRGRPRPLVAVREHGVRPVYQELSAGHGRGRTRATLKIQDGCNLGCTYCVVPRARGPARSREIAKVREEAACLAAAGYREIVLVGICLGAYGSDLDPSRELADAVEACLKAHPGIRVRLSSVEVTQLTPRLCDLLVQEPRVCRHLAIPLQSGSARVLRAMGRRYTPEAYLAAVRELGRRLPDLAVTTDVLVGFPGESDEDFAATCNLVRELGPARLHVFRYSPRTGTAAAALPDQVLPRRRTERARRLLAIGEELSTAYRARFIGRTLEVLVERAGANLEGHSDNYLKVTFSGSPTLRGRFVPVRVTHLEGGRTWGEIVGEARDVSDRHRIG